MRKIYSISAMAHVKSKNESIAMENLKARLKNNAKVKWLLTKKSPRQVGTFNVFSTDYLFLIFAEVKAKDILDAIGKLSQKMKDNKIVKWVRTDQSPKYEGMHNR